MALQGARRTLTLTLTLTLSLGRSLSLSLSLTLTLTLALTLSLTRTLTLTKVREAGVAPNVVTYSAVAKGYAALGRLAEAQAGGPPLCASCTPSVPPLHVCAPLCTPLRPQTRSAPALRSRRC